MKLKHTFLIVVAMLAAVGLCRAQTITLNILTGTLNNSVGAPLSDGSLLQVIASPDAVFSSPSATSFLGGNDVLVNSVSFDSSTAGNTPGGMYFATTVDLSASAIANYFLMIRWFPSLTTLSSAPGNSTAYGQFGYNQDTGWVAPASGSTVDLSFVTVSLGGGFADAMGTANLSTPAAVPEPTTYAAIIGALALGLVAYRRRAVAV